MPDYPLLLSSIVKQCVRQQVEDDVLNNDIDFRNDLGMDSLSLLMMYERIGTEINVDPVLLSSKQSNIKCFGDLVDKVTNMCK